MLEVYQFCWFKKNQGLRHIPSSNSVGKDLLWKFSKQM